MHHAFQAFAVLLACLSAIAASLVRAQYPGDARESRASPHYLVLLVHATGLDYQNQANLLRSLYKSQMKGGFVGHAWVLLSGIENGRRTIVEAGLSPRGATGLQFFQGVLQLAEFGYVDPTDEQKNHPRHEPDPISYLWLDQGNGYLQPASEHSLRPTYAAKLDLNPDQYQRIKARLDPELPSHRSFQLTGQQCSSFVAELAALAGVKLKHQVTMAIPREVQYNGRRVRLWTDPRYSSITLSTPDVVQEDLKRLVASGRAVDALSWYLAGAPEPGPSGPASSRARTAPHEALVTDRAQGIVWPRPR
jgi:hypothetical protein